MPAQSPNATIPAASSVPAPRTVIVLASLVLALALTGGTALARLVFARPAEAVPSPTSGPEVALVRDFYAAVNGVLATGSAGDLGELTDVVADAFVEHPDRPGMSSGRTGLIEMLTAVRFTYPAMRLVVEDIRSDGDQVAARVRVEGVEGAFLGIPLEAPHVPWGPIDLFRVAGGVIVEHWGVPAESAHFLPLTQSSISLPIDAPDPRRRPTLEQRTYASFATWSGETALGPMLILGQTGTLQVTIDETATGPASLVHRETPGRASVGEPITAGITATIVPGDLLVLTQGTRYTSSNWDVSPATVLVLTLDPPVIPGGDSATVVPPPDGITRTPVATGPAAPIPPEAVVRIGRMTLNPGSELPVHIAGGVELLIVESGSFALAAGDALAWVRRGANPESSGEHLAILTAGDAAMIPPGAVVSYRNTGATPVAVLLLTILPA